MQRQKMQVIYNYPPQRADAPEPLFPHLPSGATVYVFVGQISERKGVVVLLNAFERLLKQGRNFVLWLVGDTSWDQKDFFGMLKQRVAAAGWGERIVFFGFVKNVYLILKRSDVLVCPSLSREPLSNVVGEAKICGKPSVVFPSGGLPELIEHGVDGYVCGEKTVEALVEGIEYFASLEVRQRCGAAAWQSLEERFGLEQFRRNWAGMFVATGSRKN